MSDATSALSRPIQKGDIVIAPFVGLDEHGGIFHKTRPAYVADVRHGNADLVYLSSSPKSIGHLRYAGELDPVADGFGKGSFFNAGKTNTISTDFLHHDTMGKHLSEPSREAIERSIVMERTDLAQTRGFVKESRLAAEHATTPQVAAMKTAQADAIAGKASLAHDHFVIKPSGDIQQRTLEHGLKDVGRAPAAMLAEMQRHAPHYFPKKEATAVHAPGPAAAPADGLTKVVNPNGQEVLLGTAKKESLRLDVQKQLADAGHAGEVSAVQAHKIAVTVAKAPEGMLLAVTPDGAHHLLAAKAAVPHGATVVDAAAFRASARIAESAVLRHLGGPAGDGVQATMAAAMFFDTASGHALSKGPLGQVVAEIGEKSGAFYAVMKAQDAIEPVLDKAGKAIAEFGERSGVTEALSKELAHQTVIATKLQKDTGLDKVFSAVVEGYETGKAKLESVIKDNVHGPDNPAKPAAHTAESTHSASPSQQDPHGTASGKQGAHDGQPAHGGQSSPHGASGQHGRPEAGLDPSAALVRDTVVQEMHAAGHKDFKLSQAEAKALTHELCNCGKGDHLVVEPKGDIYLMVGQGASPSQAPRDAVVMDADAIRENAGISQSASLQKAIGEMNPQQMARAESAKEARASQAEMVATM